MRHFIGDNVVRRALEAFHEAEAPVSANGEYWAMERALRRALPLMLAGLAEDVARDNDKVRLAREKAGW